MESMMWLRGFDLFGEICVTLTNGLFVYAMRYLHLLLLSSIVHISTIRAQIKAINNSVSIGVAGGVVLVILRRRNPKARAEEYVDSGNGRADLCRVREVPNLAQSQPKRRKGGQDIERDLFQNVISRIREFHADLPSFVTKQKALAKMPLQEPLDGVLAIFYARSSNISTAKESGLKPPEIRFRPL